MQIFRSEVKIYQKKGIILYILKNIRIMIPGKLVEVNDDQRT